MPEKSKTKPYQRILILLSGLAFLGSTGFALFGLFTKSPTDSQSQAQQQNQSQENQLKQQEKGYEVVLAREPNNVVALQGLTDARLKLKDFKGAIAPLEKLVKLYPQDPNLKSLLEFVKQQAGAPPQPSK